MVTASLLVMAEPLASLASWVSCLQSHHQTQGTYHTHLGRIRSQGYALANNISLQNIESSSFLLEIVESVPFAIEIANVHINFSLSAASHIPDRLNWSLLTTHRAQFVSYSKRSHESVLVKSGTNLLLAERCLSLTSPCHNLRPVKVKLLPYVYGYLSCRTVLLSTPKIFRQDSAKHPAIEHRIIA